MHYYKISAFITTDKLTGNKVTESVGKDSIRCVSAKGSKSYKITDAPHHPIHAAGKISKYPYQRSNWLAGGSFLDF